MVSLGVSPRGPFSLCQMAKAYIFCQLKNFVTPDDIKAVFADVCGHRLMLNSKARLNDLAQRNILADIIKVEMPAADHLRKCYRRDRRKELFRLLLILLIILNIVGTNRFSPRSSLFTCSCDAVAAR